MSVERVDRDGLHRVYEQAVGAMISVAGQRDRTAEGHSKRVTRYCIAIGKSMGVHGINLANLKYAASLHDIGKVAISRKILNKLGKLTQEEFEVMKEHSTISLRILEKIDGLHEASILVKHHHERYDGKGYPDGLSGERIPFGSRIIAVAEAFDILTSDVPWRDAMGPGPALAEIQPCGGTQFDPSVVNAMSVAIASGFTDVDRAA